MDELQEMIEKLEAETSRSEADDGFLKMLQMLQDKEQELGSDPSEEEIERAVEQVIEVHKGFLDGIFQRADPDVRDERMEDAVQVIREVFVDMDLRYRDYEQQRGVYAFELGVRNEGKIMRVKVYLESFPRVCRIDAVYPFQVDPVFVYPLCEKMAAENSPRRYGALQYDAEDGELSYRYSFPITHGLHRDDFQTVLMAVIASADASYDVVRQYAVGRFRRATRDEITCRAQQLIIELDQ